MKYNEILNDWLIVIKTSLNTQKSFQTTKDVNE